MRYLSPAAILARVVPTGSARSLVAFRRSARAGLRVGIRIGFGLRFVRETRAAEDLLSLWKGFADMELRFGVAEMPTPAKIRAHVRHGVDVFLRAYRAD